MATTEKVQGGNPIERSFEEKSPNEPNRNESKEKGMKQPENTSVPTSEAEGNAHGTSALSSISGGKGRRGTMDKETPREGVSTWLDRTQDVAADVAKRTQKTATQAANNVGSTIRRYPLQSVMVGFGVGCLIGLLVPSRR